MALPPVGGVYWLVLAVMRPGCGGFLMKGPALGTNSRHRRACYSPVLLGVLLASSARAHHAHTRLSESPWLVRVYQRPQTPSKSSCRMTLSGGIQTWLYALFGNQNVFTTLFPRLGPLASGIVSCNSKMSKKSAALAAHSNTVGWTGNVPLSHVMLLLKRLDSNLMPWQRAMNKKRTLSWINKTQRASLQSRRTGASPE